MKPTYIYLFPQSYDIPFSVDDPWIFSPTPRSSDHFGWKHAWVYSKSRIFAILACKVKNTMNSKTKLKNKFSLRWRVFMLRLPSTRCYFTYFHTSATMRISLAVHVHHAIFSRIILFFIFIRETFFSRLFVWYLRIVSQQKAVNLYNKYSAVFQFRLLSAAKLFTFIERDRTS